MKSMIRSYVSRYVVPFYFDKNVREKISKFLIENQNQENTLGLPKDGKWIEAGFWENYKSESDKKSEMDLYSYLPSLFQTEKGAEGKKNSNLGDSYVYKTNGKILELEYRYEDKTIPEIKAIPFVLNDVGVLLMKNGIGFIWYEIETKQEIDIKEYVQLQHDVKELARPYSENLVKKTGYDKEKRQPIYEPFCMGKWLALFLSSEKLGIHFWAERLVTVDDDKDNAGEKIRIPDKALLFQYLFLDPISEQDRNNIIFQITNGYDEKYNAPEDIEEKLYKPFGNACFNVTNAGMSCVVINRDSNEGFFDAQFRGKLKRDYFFIYVLLLYQTYSCAYFAKSLTELPSEEKMFQKKRAYLRALEDLNGQINLFLVKSIFESVSNIDHQNGFYRYAKSELHVEEDVQSLTMGLDALKEIEQGKRDSKVDHALIIFGLMVIVSSLIDGLNSVDWFMEHDPTFMHFAVIIGIAGLTLYLFFTLWWNRKGK